MSARASSPDPVPGSGNSSSGIAPVEERSLPGDDRSKLCPACLGRYPADFNVCPKDATKLESLPEESLDALLGATIGSTYRITRVIGEGGMGKVYEASHLRLTSRRFAVKVLHKEYTRNTDVLSRFQREAEAAAAINHPHVLEVFDIARTDDGRPYIASEYLEGVDFHEYLEQQQKLSVPVAVAITRQLCGAIGAAHRAGIIHRDLKPENVFVVRDRWIEGRRAPFVKILDFGISKLQNRDTHLTRTGMIMGTPNYMAPEQARGDRVDHRADVYALGAIFYRMLTGKRAFEGTEAATVLSAVISTDPKRPRAIEPSIPEAVEVIIQKAMAKDARDRYQSMTEFDADLAAFDVGVATPTGFIESHIAITTPSSDGPTDETAQTFVSSPTPGGLGRSDQLVARGRDARLARPTIVVLTPVIAAWLLVVLVAAAAGLIRALAGREVNEIEISLMMIFSIVAAVTPLIVWVAHVARNVWRNSLRAIELAGDMRRFFTGSLAAYGLGAVVVRFFYTVPGRASMLVTSGWWDVLLLVCALFGGAFAGGIGPLARLRRRLLNR